MKSSTPSRTRRRRRDRRRRQRQEHAAAALSGRGRPGGAAAAVRRRAQPRRATASIAATRIADDLGCDRVGDAVGLAAAGDERWDASRTRILVATDGWLRTALLDPLLKHFSVVVVDEAHERDVPNRRPADGPRQEGPETKEGIGRSAASGCSARGPRQRRGKVLWKAKHGRRTC